jgi:hypothetical protein
MMENYEHKKEKRSTQMGATILTEVTSGRQCYAMDGSGAFPGKPLPVSPGKPGDDANSRIFLTPSAVFIV